MTTVNPDDVLATPAHGRWMQTVDSVTFSLRRVYSWSKAVDDGDSLDATAAANVPGLVSNPFNLGADFGPAAYDVRHIVVIKASDHPRVTGQPSALLVP